MNGLEINRAITAMVRERIPQKSKIVTILSDILGLGTKAIYRRINDEVFFTFAEVCKLSSEFGLSLDSFVQQSITGIDSTGIMPLPKDKESMSKTLHIFSQIKHVIGKISGNERSEVGIIANGIPTLFYCYNKELLRFSTYYTNYQFVNDKTYAEYKQDKVMQSHIDELYELYLKCLDIKHHNILMIRDPVKRAMEDISYMRKIHSLTEDEFRQLKQLIQEFIYNMEVTANSGVLPNFDVKCNLYLSDVRLTPNCHYLYSEEASLSSIQMYVLGWKVSFDHNHNKEVRHWFDLWRHNSVLITKSNINERIHFLEDQRKVLEHY